MLNRLSERSVRDLRVCELLVDKVEEKDLGKWRSELLMVEKVKHSQFSCHCASYTYSPTKLRLHYNAQHTLTLK